MSVFKARLAELNMTYGEYLKSDIWKRTRARYYAKHPRQCKICGSRGDIHLHHKTYKRLGAEWLMDLVPLCATHHEEFHEREGEKGHLWQKTKKFIREKTKKLKPKKPKSPARSAKKAEKKRLRAELRREARALQSAPAPAPIPPPQMETIKLSKWVPDEHRDYVLAILRGEHVEKAKFRKTQAR